LSTSVQVRPLAPGAELEAYSRLARGQFAPEAPTDVAAPLWRRILTEAPDHDPEQLRGAFVDGQLAGGYTIFERDMRVGSALLRTGCIGSLVTDQAYRMRGIGRTLMADALEFARRRGLASILLSGIPNFYSRFGYVDVFDASDHVIQRAAVASLDTGGARVRPLRDGDAPALLRLFERTFGGRTGSFARTIDIQRHRLPNLIPRPDAIVYGGIAALGWMVEDAAGEPSGYMVLSRRHPERAVEVAADDLSSAAALLRYHAERLPASAEAVHWHVPPDSRLSRVLAGHLPLRIVEHVNPDCDWLARVGHLPCLVESLLPALTERWRRRGRGSLALSLDVDGECWPLHLDDAGARLTNVLGPIEPVRLDDAALIQLVWGYRSVEALAEDHRIEAPADALDALDVLFPPGGAWIPGTDSF
jgi:predicted N-acetyltransferase YhbS